MVSWFLCIGYIVPGRGSACADRRIHNTLKVKKWFKWISVMIMSLHSHPVDEKLQCEAVCGFSADTWLSIMTCPLVSKVVRSIPDWGLLTNALCWDHLPCMFYMPLTSSTPNSIDQLLNRFYVNLIKPIHWISRLRQGNIYKRMIN